jgi:hypothetical protein
MSRSTQAAVTKLFNQFAILFGDKASDYSNFQKNLQNAILEVNSDIYHITLMPYINNEFNVYLMFKTAQKVIPVDLEIIKCDVSAWILDMKLSAKTFVDRVNDVSQPALVQEGIIEEFVKADLGRAKRKLVRMKRDTSRIPNDLIVQERLIRKLRHGLWDFEDVLKIHFGKETLEQVLEPFKNNFPIGCKGALDYMKVA